MIIAKMNNGGLILGLSKGNLKLLQAGKPIMKKIDGKDLIILHDETEEDILKGLKRIGFIKDNTHFETELEK